MSLIEAIRDENEKVRMNACKALIRIGKPAIEILTTILNDKNEVVQRFAALCLKQIEING